MSLKAKMSQGSGVGGDFLSLPVDPNLILLDDISPEGPHPCHARVCICTEFSTFPDASHLLKATGVGRRRSVIEPSKDTTLHACDVSVLRVLHVFPGQYEVR